MGLYLYGNIQKLQKQNGLIRKMTLGYETNELMVDIDTELDFIFCELYLIHLCTKLSSQ